jgi:hypothetical protein
MPFHVIVAAHDRAVSMVLSRVPFQCCSRMPQQRSIRFVFAVERRKVDQFHFHFQSRAIAELDHTFHELSSAARNLGDVVQIDLQTTNLCMRSAAIRHHRSRQSAIKSLVPRDVPNTMESCFVATSRIPAGTRMASGDMA